MPPATMPERRKQRRKQPTVWRELPTVWLLWRNHRASVARTGQNLKDFSSWHEVSKIGSSRRGVAAPMATCNAQPSGTSKVSDSTDSMATGATRVARLVHGPTWSAPERTASGPTGGRWATGQGGQSNHQQCEAVPAHASRPPCRDRAESATGRGTRGPRPGACMPWWHTSGCTSMCRGLQWRVCMDRQLGSAARPTAARAPACRPQLAAPTDWWKVRQVSGGEFGRARWRTGKFAAATTEHATRTTRLRMARDGSMWFWERSGVCSSSLCSER